MRQYHDLLRRAPDDGVPGGALAMIGQVPAGTALIGRRKPALAQHRRGE